MTAAPLSASPSTDPTGLDLNNPDHLGLLKRMYWKRFSARVKWAGWDEEDGFSEVVLCLLRRQRGKSRFDPAKSSLSNYLFMSLTCITKNMAESSRVRARGDDGVGAADDWAEDAVSTAGDPLTERMVEDLAAEMEVPMGVVLALAAGDDPFVAALDAGMDFADAVGILDAIGQR